MIALEARRHEWLISLLSILTRESTFFRIGKFKKRKVRALPWQIGRSLFLSLCACYFLLLDRSMGEKIPVALDPLKKWRKW